MAQFLLNRESKGYGDGVLTWMDIFLSSIMEGSVNSQGCVLFSYQWLFLDSFPLFFFVFLQEINGWRGWVQALIFFCFYGYSVHPGFFSSCAFSSCFLTLCIHAVSQLSTFMLCRISQSSSSIVIIMSYQLFFGGRKGKILDKTPKVSDTQRQLSISFPLIMVCHTPAFL